MHNINKYWGTEKNMIETLEKRIVYFIILISFSTYTHNFV